MQRAIIHLGLHKTGTTGQQRFLDSQSAVLLERDVLYFPLWRMRAEVTPLLCDLSSWGSAAREFFKNLTCRTLLLSDENIIGGTSDARTGRVYPWARNRILSLARILKDVEVHLVVVLRKPSQFLPSLYLEHLRHFEFIDFASYLGKLDLEAFSFRDELGWLTDLPANMHVHVRAFESVDDSGVMETTREILSLALEDSEAVDLSDFPREPVRRSFTLEEVTLAAEIAAQAGGAAAREFLNSLDALDARFGDRRYTPIAPRLAERMDARYERDLETFLR